MQIPVADIIMKENPSKLERYRIMRSILSYLQDRYQPLSIILYGSYADGSNSPNSDFDALVVISDGNKYHDASIVDGVRLDVFVLPLAALEQDIDYNEFLQIADGTLIMDTNGIGCSLKNKVLAYRDSIPPKSAEDIQEELEWCKKMLSRAERKDTEGYYRWHWLLTDSLEILCDILREPYRGPKKSLRWLKENRPYLYSVYGDALRKADIEALQKWVDYLVELNGSSGKQ